MRESIVQSERPQKTIRRMHISRWIPKAANTHSEYVTFIAFPLQQWLQECASCYAIRTLPVLFATSLCTNTYSQSSRNTQRIKSRKLFILRGFTIKTLHGLHTSPVGARSPPMSIFISSSQQYQMHAAKISQIMTLLITQLLTQHSFTIWAPSINSPTFGGSKETE